MMAILAEIGRDIGSVAARVGPAVVGVGGARPTGSGIVIEPGVVLTNAHNVWGDEVTVTVTGKGSAAAEVVGADVDSDLALLAADEADSPVTWVPDHVDPSIGVPVVVLANPGGRGLRVTVGFVSSTGRSFRGPRGRRISGAFEHTAPAAPGSSGGPVVDLEGNLVGINTRRLGRGFYLAQPAGPALAGLVADMRSGQSPRTRRLGVGLAPPEVTRKLRSTLGLDRVDGLLVRLVEDGSPAASAGVREGDVIVRAAGEALTDPDRLLDLLAAAEDSLDLELVRINDAVRVTVSLS